MGLTRGTDSLLFQKEFAVIASDGATSVQLLGVAPRAGHIKTAYMTPTVAIQVGGVAGSYRSFTIYDGGADGSGTTEVVTAKTSVHATGTAFAALARQEFTVLTGTTYQFDAGDEIMFSSALVGTGVGCATPIYQVQVEFEYDV